MEPEEFDFRLEDTETIVVSENTANQAWSAQVYEHFRNRCSNCGSEDKIKASLIVPVEAGGRLTLSNSTLICRTCELAAELLRRKKVGASGDSTRPINFWVGRSLHTALRNGLSHEYGFNSIASLVRFLMSRYVKSPDFFEDIENYVDRSSDVKINVWVPRGMYGEFKDAVAANGMTVTDSLRGLLRMYESEADRIFRRE